MVVEAENGLRMKDVLPYVLPITNIRFETKIMSIMHTGHKFHCRNELWWHKMRLSELFHLRPDFNLQ